MTNTSVRGRLRLSAVAAAAVVLPGCIDMQNTFTSADGISEQLQTFAADTLHHLLAAWLL